MVHLSDCSLPASLLSFLDNLSSFMHFISPTHILLSSFNFLYLFFCLSFSFFLICAFHSGDTFFVFFLLLVSLFIFIYLFFFCIPLSPFVFFYFSHSEIYLSSSFMNFILVTQILLSFFPSCLSLSFYYLSHSLSLRSLFIFFIFCISLFLCLFLFFPHSQIFLFVRLCF